MQTFALPGVGTSSRSVRLLATSLAGCCVATRLVAASKRDGELCAATATAAPADCCVHTSVSSDRSRLHM